ALGDSNYAQFCGHGKNLDARLQALGAKPLLDRLDCDTDFRSESAQWLTELTATLSLASQNKTSSAMPGSRVVSSAAASSVAASSTAISSAVTSSASAEKSFNKAN